MVPIILNKLPGEVRKHLAREHRSKARILSDLRRGILDKIDIMDEGQEIESTKLTRYIIFLYQN